MKQTIEFTACENLDFSDNYSAQKNAISTSDGVKACWNRPAPYPGAASLVQFCKRRGRMNGPTMCLCESDGGCFDYKNAEHRVEVDS